MHRNGTKQKWIEVSSLIEYTVSEGCQWCLTQMLPSNCCDCINKSKNNIADDRAMWHEILIFTAAAETSSGRRQHLPPTLSKQLMGHDSYRRNSFVRFEVQFWVPHWPHCLWNLPGGISSVIFDLFFVFLELLVDHFQSSEEISQEQDEKRQGQHEHLPFLAVITGRQLKKSHSIVQLPKVAKE